jgi:hypothetical protein
VKSDHRSSEASRVKLAFIIFSSALMLVANIFVFVPFEIYQSNTGEFEVGYLQMLVRHWGLIAVNLPPELRHIEILVQIM